MRWDIGFLTLNQQVGGSSPPRLIFKLLLASAYLSLRWVEALFDDPNRQPDVILITLILSRVGFEYESYGVK